MATLTHSLCLSFLKGVLDGEFDFSSDTAHTYKIALYTSLSGLSELTTAYTSVGEVTSGGGYTTGGKTLTISTNPTTDNTYRTVYMGFTSPTWASSSFSAAGALIYKYNGSTNPTVAVIDFGETKTSSAGNFVVNLPADLVTSAIIRFSVAPSNLRV